LAPHEERHSFTVSAQANKSFPRQVEKFSATMRRMNPETMPGEEKTEILRLLQASKKDGADE
jgi:hypothetical protein